MPAESDNILSLDETNDRSSNLTKQDRKMDIRSDQDMVKTILNMQDSSPHNPGTLQNSYPDTSPQSLSNTPTIKQANANSGISNCNSVFTDVVMSTGLVMPSQGTVTDMGSNYISAFPGSDSSLNGGLPHDLHNVKVHDFCDDKPIIHHENMSGQQSYSAVSPEQCYELKMPFSTENVANGVPNQSQYNEYNEVDTNHSQMYSDSVNVIKSNQSPTRTFNENPVFSVAETLTHDPLSPQQVLNTNISPAFNTNTDEKLYINIVDLKNDNQFDIPLSSKLPTFTALAAQSASQTTNSISASFLQPQSDQKSVLEELLTKQTLSPLEDVSASSPSSVSSLDYRDDTSISSPNSSALVFIDTNTQSTLIAKSEKLHIDSETSPDDLQILNQVGYNWNLLPENEPSKALKSRRHSDAPSAAKENEPELVEKLFDAGIAASSTSDFIFSKFGSDLPPNGLFTFGESEKTEPSADLNTTTVLQTVTAVQPDFEKTEMKVQTQIPVTRSQTHSRRSKEPTLNQQFPSKIQGFELRILDQPEEQHRARYLTEGSRGAVKNRSQDGHPLIKLLGFEGPAVLQVFVGNDTGRVRPHGFYQACKVAGKNSTPCREREIDGTVVIEIDLCPVSDMTASLDNVGILKLRNADVEQRIGLAKAKKKSTKARIIFRVVFTKEDGSSQTLQTASCSILCTQPIGQPEACKLSRFESTVEGGDELFIIGKNFMKGTKVLFQEFKNEDSSPTWEQEADIDKDYFQPTHLICKIPAYHDVTVMKTIKAQIVVSCAGKTSDPQPFTYTPVGPIVKQETPMETDQCTKRNIPFTVSPEALELNKQIQESQQTAPTSMFQLPPGTLTAAERTGMNVDTVVMSTSGHGSEIISPVTVSQQQSFPPQSVGNTIPDTDQQMESIQSILQAQPDLQKVIEQQFLNQQTAGIGQGQISGQGQQQHSQQQQQQLHQHQQLQQQQEHLHQQHQQQMQQQQQQEQIHHQQLQQKQQEQQQQQQEQLHHQLQQQQQQEQQQQQQEQLHHQQLQQQQQQEQQQQSQLILQQVQQQQQQHHQILLQHQHQQQHQQLILQQQVTPLNVPQSPTNSVLEQVVQHHDQVEMMDQGIHVPVSRIGAMFVTQQTTGNIQIGVTNSVAHTPGITTPTSTRPVINFQTFTNDSALQGVPRLATGVSKSLPQVSQQSPAPQIIICGGTSSINSSNLAGILGQPPVQMTAQTPTSTSQVSQIQPQQVQQAPPLQDQQTPPLQVQQTLPQQVQQVPQILTTQQQSAPSIVILPGGSNSSAQGNNNSQNEVENLLRSILGGWQQT